MQETQELWVQSLGQDDPLEEEMATHSNILAWKIPWTEEPGRLYGVAKSQTQLNDWAQSYPTESTMNKGLHLDAMQEIPGFPHLFWVCYSDPYNAVSGQPEVFCFPSSMSPYCSQEAWFPATWPLAPFLCS